VPGDPHELGAVWDGTATNLAVVSTAGRYGGTVSACVIGDDGMERTLPLYPTPEDIWHGRITGLVPGQRYGLRATGPCDPSRGLYFDPSVLLVDPYARAFTPVAGGGPGERLGVVIDNAFD
jgi:isoamylase